MARARTTWGIGEYPRMALELEPAAGAAVHVAGIGPGVRVLDIATGTGNAALKAAELGAAVTALDIEPVLIEQAERRARSAGVDIRWLLGDFERLPVPDGSADVVLSIFGVMYAADHPAAARELARATAPGGRVGNRRPGSREVSCPPWVKCSEDSFPHHCPAVDRPAAGATPTRCGASWRTPTCDSRT